ncbi:MAG: aminotransferase class V-fold PLP-dependent enzyme [candidate division WOR-3 bacterium]
MKDIRQDFPTLNLRVGERPLCYLDNAATTLRPTQVIECMDRFYRDCNANIHRGIYHLSVKATKMYDQAHQRVASFIRAKAWQEIIFTRNTTESINLVAYAFGDAVVHEGDEIVTTVSEHHSNMIPWQRLAARKRANLNYIPVKSDGTLDLDEARKLITPKTRIVALQHVSNLLGTVHPVSDVAEMAHRVGALVVVDAAQSVPHMPFDVRDIGADFVAFSGHKMLGPTGIGILWGREELLREGDVFLTGGSMISEVTLEGAKWNTLPWKYEAGTPNICGAIGLSAAIDYLESIGLDEILAHEKDLLEYAVERLSSLGFVKLYGPAPDRRVGIVSFNVEGVHPHDVAQVCDSFGVAVRSGHHCAQPLSVAMGASYGTARASFYLYNTKDEVDALVEALIMAKKELG